LHNPITFTVHKDLLTSHSRYFAAASNGHFKEAQSNAIRLPGDEPGLFAVAVDAVYRGHIVSDNRAYRSLGYVDDLKLYVILDKYTFVNRDGSSMATSHLDEVSDCRVERLNDFTSEHVTFIFNNSTVGSMLREHAAMLIGDNIESAPYRAEHFKECIQMYPDLAFDVVRKLWNRTKEYLNDNEKLTKKLTKGKREAFFWLGDCSILEKG